MTRSLADINAGPARRESCPEMSARQYFREQKLVPYLGRSRALAHALIQETRGAP